MKRIISVVQAVGKFSKEGLVLKVESGEAWLAWLATSQRLQVLVTLPGFKLTRSSERVLFPRIHFY